MRKFKTTHHMRKEDTLVAIVCDWCGKQVGQKWAWTSDMTQFEIGFGYGSERDGTKAAFDICDRCYHDVFETQRRARRARKK